MALYHVFDVVVNSNTGVPIAGVQVRVKFDGTDVIAPIYATQSGEPFTPANFCLTDVQGMYSFYVEASEYTLEFLVGGELLKSIRNFRPAEFGLTGPANSTYALTGDLEGANVSNISAILAEAGKAGTFTIREYADFTTEVAADTDKMNYIRSASDTTKAWVRTTILPSAAAQIGMADGRSVESAIRAKPDARAVIQSSEAIGGGRFVNVYNAGGDLRVRRAIASDPLRFANGYAPSGIANGASGAIFFMGLNSTVTVPDDAAEAWLSDSDPGGFALTPPSAEGSIVQSLGPAVAGLGIFFTFRERVLL